MIGKVIESDRLHIFSGFDTYLGTLNLLTPAIVAGAAKEGLSQEFASSLDWPLNKLPRQRLD